QLPGLSGMVDLVVNADYSVLLSDFEGAWQADSREVRLSWTSHIEIDSDHFEVESSADGIAWTNAGFVNAAGISLDSLSYQFTDGNSPLRSSGNAFYRLRIVDTEGGSAYSSVLQISRPFEPDLQIYPNPFRDKVNIALPGLSEPTTLYLRVMDAMGRVLYESEHEALGEVVVLEPATWIRGLYFVQLRSADGTLNLCREVIKLP
ncbi:MAG: T9SS C-terminal target domain-containing protein, partial [Bacteroidetes bacterium]